MNHAPITANATYCATLCDQLVADGLTAAFIAPGSRSTPVALALVAHPAISVEVFHEERSAAFAALGHGLATGKPAVVLCSSGTAGAHFYAAVIEADVAAVPMIVITADRPPELWGRGAPQTIDQTHLYGGRVRAFFEPGPPDDLNPDSWRGIARELWNEATGALPGPVHANLSFRDPLTGTPGELPAAIAAIPARPSVPIDADLVVKVAAHLTEAKGVIVVGRNETSASTVLRLAEQLGWPVLADHRSGCRNPTSPHVVRHFDALLREPIFAAAFRPDVVLRIGEIVSSKSTSQWLAASAAQGTRVIASRPQGRHIDPEAIAELQFDEAGFIAELNLRIEPSATHNDWLDGWRSADDAAVQTIAAVVAAAEELTEIEIAQLTLDAVATGGSLVVSSSMPVRDIEWFGQNRSDIEVFANRGANGIDGIVSTAIGIALTGRPTICLIGDVAFLHDSPSLIALKDRDIDLTVVVTNNDGGAIFSFLPQHELLDSVQYEALFGTPHGANIAGLAAAHGIDVHDFDPAVLAPDGLRIVVAETNREQNHILHDRVHAQVCEAVRGLTH